MIRDRGRHQAMEEAGPRSAGARHCVNTGMASTSVMHAEDVMHLHRPHQGLIHEPDTAVPCSGLAA